MNIIKLVKAFRTDANTVCVMFRNMELNTEFVVQWSNIHPETGVLGKYDMQIYCLSGSDMLTSIVEEAIKDCDGALYEQIRDAFDALDCENLA